MKKLSFSNTHLPAPYWFRLTKKIVSWASNLTLAILVLYIPEDSKTLLVCKLIQSGSMEFFDLILADVEQPKDTPSE
jgi:hypothetical protein